MLWVLLVFTVGEWVGALLVPIVALCLESLAHIGPFLSAMAPLGAGYLMGFLVLVIIFAGLYAASYRADPLLWTTDAAPTLSLGDFLFFSLMTATTVGYGTLRPAPDAPTRVLVGLEPVVSIAWNTVVFAAVVASLAQRFAAVQGRQAGDSQPDTPDSENLHA